MNKLLLILLLIPFLESAPIEKADPNLVNTLIPDFDDQMLVKLSKVSDLDERVAKTPTNGSDFFLNNVDLFANLTREVFLDNGKSPELADFVVGLMRLGSSNNLQPVKLSVGIQSLVEFRQKWKKLPEADKETLTKIAPALAQAVSGDQTQN